MLEYLHIFLQKQNLIEILNHNFQKVKTMNWMAFKKP